MEAKQREREEQMTDEERLAEKLRLQKVQEDADLRLAMETFGVTDAALGGIDGMNPTNKAEFAELCEALLKKIGQLKNQDEFPNFVEELVRGACVHCK